jgi:hypothetical protein
MRRVSQAVMAAVLVCGAVRAEAQLPTVEQVYDKYATAVGGREAWAKVGGRTELGTADITFANMSGSYARYASLPNKMRMIIDIGVVKIDQGFDGEKGWADQGQGPSRMPPEQEKQMAEPSANGAAFLDPSRFAKASVLGKETVDGVDMVKLSTTSKSGQESTEYFDAGTGLRTMTISTTPMGSQKVLYKDYKEFEGKKVPTKVVQVTPQGDVVLNIQTVSFLAPDAALFKAPDVIKN